MQRSQFTFYRSYWEALKTLSKKDRLAVYDAIAEYALDGREPALSGASTTAFILIRPTLDAGRTKAAAGKYAASVRQMSDKHEGSAGEACGKREGSVTEACPSGSNKKEGEKEIEIEKEKKVEKENECYKKICGGDNACEENSGKEELVSIGLQPGEYLGITSEHVSVVKRTAEQIFQDYTARGCLPLDYRRVFEYVTRMDIAKGVQCIDSDAVGLLRYAFEVAFNAGNPGKWSYIDGILERISSRGITTAAQAKAWDEDRRYCDHNEGEMT